MSGIPNPFIGVTTEEQERLDYIFANMLSADDVAGLTTTAVADVVNISYNTDERWVNRGDPASVDFSIAGGELTDDGAWHDLDLTTVHIDIANKMVLLRGKISSGGVAEMEIRAKGQTNAENVSYLHPPSGGSAGADMLVIPDADGIIQYKISASATVAELTVAAYEHNFSSGVVDGASSADVEANTLHSEGDGTDHSGVSDNAGDIVTNAAAIGVNASAVVVNHSDITTNENDIATNVTAIGLNTTHRTSDGKNHSDVVLNNTHRASDGDDHTFIDQDVTIAATGVVHDGLQVVTKLIIPVYTVSGEPL